MSSEPIPESNTERRSGSDQRQPRSLNALWEATASTEVRLRGIAQDTNIPFCPFPCAPNEEGAQDWCIDVPWPEDDGAPWELLKWFAQIMQSALAPDPKHWQQVYMALPSSLSKEARAQWHRLVEGFRGHIPLTAVSQGVGEERHLQILPVAGPKRALPIGKTKIVSEQAKELWKWCQEEGGADWSYSQGEIEDLLQSKQPLPPQLQQLMDARSVGKQLFERIAKSQEAEAIELLDRERRAAYMRDADNHGYAIHHAVFQDLHHVVARLAIMPGVIQQRDSHRQSPHQLANRLKRKAVLEILSWAAQ